MQHVSHETWECKVSFKFVYLAGGLTTIKNHSIRVHTAEHRPLWTKSENCNDTVGPETQQYVPLLILLGAGLFVNKASPQKYLNFFWVLETPSQIVCVCVVCIYTGIIICHSLVILLFYAFLLCVIQPHAHPNWRTFQFKLAHSYLILVI